VAKARGGSTDAIQSLIAVNTQQRNLGALGLGEHPKPASRDHLKTGQP
jgi:hypothetical protein